VVCIYRLPFQSETREHIYLRKNRNDESLARKIKDDRKKMIKKIFRQIMKKSGEIIPIILMRCMEREYIGSESGGETQN
jgi:hypothetical protein